MREDLPNIADVGAPAVVINEAGGSPIVLVCEHASRYIPAALDALGLSETDLCGHIAWDIGAEPVARLLSQVLDATLIVQRYSRLVYDCNRPPASPDAIPAISELTIIPGNQGLNKDARKDRIDHIYRPFHARVADVVASKVDLGITPVFVTVHSFTPVFKGQERDFELGVLHDEDSRLADIVLAIAESRAGFETRRNEPYGPQDGVTHTLNEHSAARGLLNVMFEIRNDCIADEPGQAMWADIVYGLLTDALRSIDGPYLADPAVVAH